MREYLLQEWCSSLQWSSRNLPLVFHHLYPRRAWLYQTSFHLFSCFNSIMQLDFCSLMPVVCLFASLPTQTWLSSQTYYACSPLFPMKSNSLEFTERGTIWTAMPVCRLLAKSLMNPLHPTLISTTEESPLSWRAQSSLSFSTHLDQVYFLLGPVVVNCL